MESRKPHEQQSALKKCGAKTRAGTPCEKLPSRGRTRCRLHGGASPIGFGHPRFKHGAYSKCWLSGWDEQQRRRKEQEARVFKRIADKAYEDALVRHAALVERADQLRALRLPGRPRKVPDFTDYYFDLVRVRLHQYHVKAAERRQRRRLAAETREA